MFNENQLVEIKWVNKTRNHYESKGYVFTNYNDLFYVKAKDLPNGSKNNVEVICDFCNNSFYPSYVNYNKRANKKVDSCNGCRILKQWSNTKNKRTEEKFNELRKFCEEKDYLLLTQESEYDGVFMNIKYICKKHGLQIQTLDNMLHGHGCIDCSYEERGLNCRHSIEYIKSIIESFNSNKLLNPNDYIGSNVRNLKIECGLCGKTYITSFSDYIIQNQTRCKSCSKSESVGEMKIRMFLEDNNVSFVQEKTFDNCMDKKRLPFDFYLPKHNLIVEFDGQHHFYECGFGNHEITKRHDNIKNQYCKDNNIDILRIPYWEGSNIEEILTKQLNL